MDTSVRDNNDRLSPRVKIVLIVICLLVVLAAAGFAVMNTVQAVHNLQQEHALAKSGDVRTIRSWMTIPYIARTYHVPEGYLYQTLHLDSQSPPRHATLHALASHYQKPVDAVITDVQHAIVAYRRTHGHSHLPPGASPGTRPGAPPALPPGSGSVLQGRMVY